MHFSLITPIPGHERKAGHEWTGGAYLVHQRLWRFLPAPSGTARSFVFRRRHVDSLSRFYVVSDCAPVAPSAHWQVQSKPYSPSLAAGDWLAIDLRANPVVVTTRNAAGKPARHDVVMQEKTRPLKARQLARWTDWPAGDRPALPGLVRQTCGQWLQARCERLGITVGEASLRIEGYEQHRGKQGEPRFSCVDFSGNLQVVGANALRQALYGGVGHAKAGHAKAFGYGLLLLRPIR